MSQEPLMQNGGIQTILPPLATPQVVYLDFDGAETSYYNRDLDICIPNVLVEDSGIDDGGIAVIVDALNAQFGDDVIFTAELPTDEQYSTIYIGVTSAFDEYGSFLGLAETIDSGNQIRDDNAFVLLDSSASVERVVSVIAHETGHIVQGMEHSGEGLDRFADMNVGKGQHLFQDYLVSNDKLNVYDGGIALMVNVSTGGEMNVYDGGGAITVNVSTGGVLNVYNSGMVADGRITNGGKINVYNNGRVGYIEVSNGVINVYNTDVDFTVSSTVLLEGGVMNVFNGGVAKNTTVNAGCSMAVYDGSVANNTTVNDGGEMAVDSGGVANNTTVNGCGMSIYYGYVIPVVLVSGGKMTIYNGGVATSTTVKDGGKMAVESGGVATSTTVNYGDMTIYNGGVVSNTTVISLGNMGVNSGGMATNTTLKDGGMMGVNSVGVATNTTVNSGGTMGVSSGGVATSTTVNSGGTMGVSRGGVATSTTVNSGGEMVVYDGSVATSTTVNDGGMMVVYSGGVANNTTVSQGIMDLFEGVVTSTTVNNGGKMVVESGGVAISTTVNSGGKMTIYNGGVATNTTVNGGGTMGVSRGGMATSTTVNEGGLFTVCGEANNTTVHSGGSLVLSGDDISAGGIHGGSLQIAEGGIVSAFLYHDGDKIVVPTLDFTVSEQKDRNIPIVNHYDYIRFDEGNLSFTITVSGDKEYGRYALAGYASTFNSTVTVKTTTGEQIGALTVNGDAFDYDAKNYSLVLDVNTLVLDIIDTKPPTVSELTVGKPEKGGTAKITIVPSKALSQLQYAWNGGDWTELPVEEPLEVSENGLVSFRLVDLPGNETITDAYEVDCFNVLMTEIAIDVSGAQFTVDWSEDASKVWATNYDVLLGGTGGEVALAGIEASGLEAFQVPACEFNLSLKPAQSDEWTNVEPPIVIQGEGDGAPQVIQAEGNGLVELMFARGASVWSESFWARHVGVGDWSGTGQAVGLAGRNRLEDIYLGSDDATILLLTDDENGDALFADDVFSAFPEEADAQARVAKIDEIRAGAGNDVVDLTSQRFEYVGTGMTVRGGLGDDVIWANEGDNVLFGDAGNDQIIGASGNDVIVGGVGNDILHGGGGEDLFVFGDNWGSDTVEQAAAGKVTLWFDKGDEGKWDEETRTYTDGDNSVKVIGECENISLKFGDDGSSRFQSLQAARAFAAFTSEGVFENQSKGMLA